MTGNYRWRIIDLLFLAATINPAPSRNFNWRAKGNKF
jgi:hypothetical protein